MCSSPSSTRPSSADASEASDPKQARMTEVAEGVYAWIQPDGSWWINNAGFVAGDESVLVVDTCTTEERTTRFLDAIAEHRPAAGLDYAVNTHHHGDHTFGNCMLPESITLIGHENMRTSLLADTTPENFPAFWAPRPQLDGLSRRVPNITLSSDLTLYVGGRRVELLHPGYAAHTEGDVVVWVPDSKVLFTGDLLFPGHTPMVMAGRPSGALAALDWMAALDPQIIVPGHGEVLDRAAFNATLLEHAAYYRFVLAESQRGVADDLTPLDVARTADLSAWDHLLDKERFILNVHAGIGELRGTEVKRTEALADAVEWIGHPITTHV